MKRKYSIPSLCLGIPLAFMGTTIYKNTIDAIFGSKNFSITIELHDLGYSRNQETYLFTRGDELRVTHKSRLGAYTDGTLNNTSIQEAAIDTLKNVLSQIKDTSKKKKKWPWFTIQVFNSSDTCTFVSWKRDYDPREIVRGILTRMRK